MLERCLDKLQLHRFFAQSPELQLYAIGDLDPFFWRHAKYFVHRVNKQISAVVIVYQATDLPIVLALGDDTRVLSNMLEELLPSLGNRIYCHVSYGCEPALLHQFEATYSEHQGRMILQGQPDISIDTDNLVRLGPEDAQRLQDFFQLSYPSNWFDPDMLECHPFVGYELHHQLVSVAGIHVFSQEYSVAALGNITTHPDFRGRGYAAQCTAALCKQLSNQVTLIGLNVHTENSAAIRAYEKVGFRMTHRFAELMLVKL